MSILIYPPYKKYASLFGPQTLANRIREESWELDTILDEIKKNAKELEKIDIKTPVAEVKNKSLLFTEAVRNALVDLELIIFYDASIFYLYYGYLQEIYYNCRNALSKLARDKKKFKNEIKEVLGEANNILKMRGKMVKKLYKFKKNANKNAKHAFILALISYRERKRLNTLIKIKAMDIKKNDESRKELMNTLNIEKNPNNVKRILGKFENVVKDVGDDIKYTKQLMKKVREDLKKIEGRIKKIKKESKQNFNEVVKLFSEIDNKINQDLIFIYQNSLKQLNEANRGW